MNKKTLNKRVTIADMVYLTNDREGIVRFKGKTGFGLGEWYGIELRTEHKTRHDGLIHGKRYFRCPRNKGLFVRKQIIVDVMDKKTAVQKARVFKMGGSLSSRYRKKNKTKKNKIKKKTQNKKPLNKKITKPKEEQIENNININNKNISKRSSIIQKEGDDTKYIKLSVQDINEVEANDTADETDNDNDNDDKEEEQQEEMKDFSSKESFSNPKSRKYFGKDQIFTTLDRRRSKNEDVFLMDNVGNNIAVKMPTLMEEEETEKEEEELEEKIILKDDNNNNISDNNKTKSIQFRPFGSETHTPKVQLIAPSHIKQISMEFTKGNLKAKLKKVVTTKKKKRNGTIRNVYSKYAIRADYPKLDDLRNETLVSEFLSFNLYKLYRNEVSIINDYTIDKAIECGCFYLPDRIGFRLADYKTYKIFEGLCNELLSILHDEWNKKDKPHKKNIDWTLLIKDKENKGINAASKRSKSPNPIGHKHNKNRGRNRGVSGGGMYLKQLSEKRKKSKRKTSDLVSTSPLVSMEESDGLIINEESETVFNNNDITIENINAIMNEDIMDDEEEQMLQQRPIQRSGSQNNIEINIYNKKDKKDRKDKKHKKDKHDKDKEKEREKRRKSHIKAHRRKKKQNKSIHIRGDIRSNFYNYYGIGSSLWDNNYIISCRLTLSRNIRGFRFSNVITRNERRNIETILSSILNQCNEGTLKGRYRAYHQINSSKIPLLIETDKLFPKPDAPPLIMAGYARDWPESRGIFINNNKNLYMWCNYLEHLHFISVQNDGNILQAFKRLFDSEQKLETLIKQRQQIFLDNLKEKQKNILEKTDNNKNRITKQEYKIKKMSFDGLKTGFVCDDELGYITSNPQYFGTSMRVYVTVKLPNLIKHDKFNDILEIRNLTAYQHDVDSAQKMFNTYANQLPTNKEVRQRIRSKTAEQEKLLNVNDEQKVNVNNNNNNNEQKENDFMSNLNLNLPEIITNKQYNEYNQPKVSLKTLKTLKISQEEKKENDENETNVLIHDDEDLGDVVNPIHYKEEITIYQTTSLGISEIDQVRNMIEAINYLIEMEKLLSAGNKLDERIKSEKIKKNEKKFKKLI